MYSFLIWKLNNTLKPLEIAINELSKNSTTSVETEGIFQFMIKTLSKIKNTLSEDLLQCLKKHITERRIKVLYTLTLYLSTKNFPVGNAFINYSNKIETKWFASQLYYRLFNDIEDTGSEFEDLNSDDFEYNL